MTGLQFNPYRTLDANSNEHNQSVPTLVDEYLSPQQRATSMRIPNIQWDPSKLAEAREKVQWAINSTPEERDSVLNPMYSINRWNEGLAGLSDEDRRLWEQDNYEKIYDLDEQQKDRVWRNQEFIKAAGLDVFNAIPNYEDRDKLYMDYLTSEAVARKFEGNDNINQLMSLTPEGKMELLNSDYKNDVVLKSETDVLKAKARKQGPNIFQPSKWREGLENLSEYSLGERLKAIGSEAASQAGSGATTGGGVGAMIGGVGAIPGSIIGAASGAISGVLTGLEHPENDMERQAQKLKSNNDEILNKITVADNNRLKEQSQDEITGLNQAYINDFIAGKISEEDINNEFDELALNGKRVTTDELGNVQEFDYTGSNYYSAFKDTDEFAHFDVYDKMKYLAQSKVLGDKYGEGKALQILEQDMQDYISDAQTKWQWAGNSLKGIWVGGIANLGMNYTGLGALNAKLWYGEEGLTNYLNGKDASGNGEDNLGFNNPQYWNKVDEYNDLGLTWFGTQDNMAIAEANGGISPANNIYKPGTEGDFWSWSTLNEAVKMNKFFWSDAVKNIGLAKALKGITSLAGGIELAPGVLASESKTAAKVINKLGSAGIMANSSVGIDAAYGMQTYNEVLQQNNEKLDKIIDTDVEAEVNRRLEDPRVIKNFEDAVNAENERRRQRAGERGSYIAVDEYKAWQDYVQQITNLVRQEQEALHAEDRQQAENDAANAYAVDATLEAIRMSATNGIFRSYMFDKGTLNALKLNNPYVNTTVRNGAYAIGKHAVRNRALSTLGKNIWGGFHSNYYDDITVGYAEGFGLQDYNNYLLQKYNPAAYGAVLDDYVNPYVAAMTGAKDAALEKRSFIDGGVGALGTLFTAAPNISGMVSHQDRMKRISESIDRAERGGGKAPGISFAEMANSYISSPVLDAITEAREASRMTQAEINRVNSQLKENAFAFDNIVEATSALNERAIAREGTSIMQAEDAKDKEAFALASSLLTIKNSGAAINAQAEVDKSTWSKKKKASATLSSALNTILGIQMFEAAESPYTRVMLALQDASTIDELSEMVDNISEEDAEEDNETAKAWRQTNLIKTFLGLDANKNAIQDMSDEEKVAFAKERLKKNATSLLDMMNKTEELQKKFENSIAVQYSPEIGQQLMYQYVLDDRWKERSKDLEEDITGETISDDADTWFRRKKQNQNSENTVMAKYGSIQGHSKALEAQTKRVEEAQKLYDKAAQDVKKENDPTTSIAENARIKAARLFFERSAKERLAKEKALLDNIASDKQTLETALQGAISVVMAEDILHLNADERLRMLDDHYRSDYSKAQQDQIDIAKNMLIEDGTPLGDAMQKVRDAAILEHRITDNMETAKKIMTNPLEAKQMQQALIDNRKKQMMNYFNNKIVNEAFMDFMNDPTATVSRENVMINARRYSTAVLNGVQKAAEKALKTARSMDGAPDITLSNLVDGIEDVLDEREERMEQMLDLDDFIRKTNNVDHTDVIYKSDENLGQEVTTEKELSDNDRKILDYAIDYAVERNIPADEMVQMITVDNYDDFQSYIQERNHSGITVEEQAVPVSQQYLNSLMTDIIQAFRHKDNVQKAATEEKQVTPSTQSVSTTPVETKGAKPNASDERRPDDSYNPDPFGVLGKKTEETERDENGKNDEILDEATVLNEKLLGDVNSLLNEVDKLDTTDEVKNNLRDIIASLVSSRSFANIKELQNYVYGEAALMDKETSDMATILIGKDIAGTPKEVKAKAENPQNIFEPEQTKPFLGLETIDLDEVIDNPRRKAMSDYVKSHNIVPFLQKLYTVWNDDIKNKGKRHQAQVYFIYDPGLAGQVQEEIESRGGVYIADQTAPVIMALEITDINRDLIDDESQLVKIKDRNNQDKFYQPLGFMPAALNTKEYLQGTVDRMPAIRGQIKYSETVNGKEIPLTETRLIRYAPKNNTGKDNGTAIHTNIAALSSHTDEESIPHSTESTPKSSALNLMERNMNTPTSAFIPTTLEERQAYDEARKKGPIALRANSLYKKMRDAFINRLSKREIKSANLDDKPRKELTFHILKGSNDKWPKPVFIKAVGETLDRNTGRLIVDVLRDIDSGNETSEEAINKGQELIDSNSRFKRLFEKLSDVSLPVGLFNTEGKIAVSDFNSKLATYAKDVERAIDNNLNVDDLSVTAEIEDIEGRKIINIHVYSGEEELSTLKTVYNGNLTEGEFASFIKDLILDREGNVRQGIKDDRYERVKWQVDYDNATVANNPDAVAKERNAARTNLAGLYDDGVLEMQVTDLAYPSRSVTASINGFERSKLWPESVVKPQQKAPEATETKTNFETEAPSGKVDSDSGMHTDVPTRQDILSGLAGRVIATINKMITDSKDRNLSKDNPAHYIIDGQIYSRVTSVKYDMEGMGERFNPQNAWALPSTAIGTSFDTFGRDVLNGVFDSMTDAEREAAFGNYDNSTAKNYAEAYKALKAFEARLASQGQTIITIGTKEDPGHITAKGMMDVAVKGYGGITTKQLRIAGTLDILAVDSDGNLHIYDFKTHHGDVFNEDSAKKDGYDRQLSMYAKFLEEEYGLPVKSINILPIKADYPVPSGKDNKGEAIPNAEMTYRESRPGSSQLEIKEIGSDDSTFKSFDGANFQVEEEFSLDRLSDRQMEIAYDKMTPTEKEAIVEAIQDQDNSASAQETTADKLASVKPEITESEEEESEGFNLRNKRRTRGNRSGNISSDEAINSIDPTKGTEADIEEQKNNCGGRK